MPFNPAFTGSSLDPDRFSIPLEGRQRFPRGQNRDVLRNFTPSARQSAEDILRNLKEARAGRTQDGARDMFFNDCFLTPEAMFTKADEGGDDSTLRGRHPHHPHFRVPSWFSDDQDMKDITHRMSHAPHFATLGRRGGSGGPWRERRHSGGSAVSGTSEDDGFDPSGDRMSQGSSGSSEQPGVPHEIPIRFEAPPPPSQYQQQQQQQVPPAPQPHPQPQEPEGCVNKPLRTTSAVDATEYGSNGGNASNRNSRCASAPPEMAEQQQLAQQQQGQPQDPSQQQQQPQRFVSKISITPQAPTVPQPSTSPQYSPLPAKFNTVPRPFVSGDPQQQQQYQQYQQPYPQQYQQQPPPQQYSTPPPPQQQPPLGFFPPPPHPDQQWQFSGQQQYPQQQYTQQDSPRGGQRPSVVRNIPIFVEGRDDPIEQDTRPAPGPQWTQTRPQPQAPQPQQYVPPQHQVPPQPRPVPQQPQQQQQPQPTPRQKRQQAHQPTPPPQQPIPHPVPMPMPEPHGIPPNQVPTPQAPPQEEAPVPEPQPAPAPAPAKDPRMVQIERVSGTVKELAEKVDGFQGAKRDREFLYLDEMLTRALLQLDNVDPDGCDEVRQARRAVIKEINAAISNLESKAKEQPQQQKPEQDIPAPTTPAVTTQDSTAPAPTTPTPVQEGVEEKKEEQKQEEKVEKMETNQQEQVNSSEPAVGNAESAPAQPPVSS